jgi:hypothetical protein
MDEEGVDEDELEEEEGGEDEEVSSVLSGKAEDGKVVDVSVVEGGDISAFFFPLVVMAVSIGRDGFRLVFVSKVI